MAEAKPPNLMHEQTSQDDKIGALYSAVLTMYTVLQQIQATLLRTVPQEIVDPKLQFWTTYKTVGDEFDTEFLQKHFTNMDGVMIFAGLFTAVNATFAGMMFPILNPDPNVTTQALLQALVLSVNGTVPPGIVVPEWTGPSATDIWVQCLLYASLSGSLFVALGAVLGKQWLSYFSSVGERGTPETRGLERQRKLAGQERYRFHGVLEMLPVILQVSLLLFGLSLTVFMLHVQRTIGTVLAGINGACACFYFYVVWTSFVDPNSPFYSPVSVALKTLLKLPVRGATQLSHTDIVSAVKRRISKLQGELEELDLGPLIAAHLPSWRIPRVVSNLFVRVRRVFRPVGKLFAGVGRFFNGLKRHFWHGPEVEYDDEINTPSLAEETDATNRLAVMACSWVLATSTDPTMVAHAARFAPEYVWTDEEIRNVPWDWVDEIVTGMGDCVRPKPGGGFEIPAALRARAVAFAIGFLFFHWEKLTVDGQDYLDNWVRSLDWQKIVQWCSQWKSIAEAVKVSDNVGGETSANLAENGDTLFVLVYHTFDRLSRYYDFHRGWQIDAIPRCRTPLSSPLDALQARTLLYLALHQLHMRRYGLRRCMSKQDLDSVSRVYTYLAPRTPSRPLLVIHFLASALFLSDPALTLQSDGIQDLLYKDSLEIADVADGVFGYTNELASDLGRRIENGQPIEGPLQPLSHIVQWLPIAPDNQHWQVLLHTRNPAQLLAICSSFLSSTTNYNTHITDLFPVVARVLETSIAYALKSRSSRGTAPTLFRSDDFIWSLQKLSTPDTLGWLLHFLAVIHDPSTALSAPAVWQATSHAFLVVVSLRDASAYIDNPKLLRALDWALHIPAPTEQSPSHSESTDVLQVLRYTTLSLIHSLFVGNEGLRRHERCTLLRTHIPDFPAAWSSLEDALGASDKTVDPAFSDVLGSVAQSSPEYAWMNDPENDVFIRPWISAVGRLMEASNGLRGLNIARLSVLVTCVNLFQSTDPWWQRSQVQCVALAVLSVGWGNWSASAYLFSEKLLCDHTAKFISTEYWQTEDQELLKYKELVFTLRNYMQSCARRSESEHLRDLTSQVEARTSHITRVLRAGNTRSSDDTAGGASGKAGPSSGAVPREDEVIPNSEEVLSVADSGAEAVIQEPGAEVVVRDSGADGTAQEFGMTSRWSSVRPVVKARTAFLRLIRHESTDPPRDDVLELTENVV